MKKKLVAEAAEVKTIEKQLEARHGIEAEVVCSWNPVKIVENCGRLQSSDTWLKGEGRTGGGKQRGRVQ